nr:hypothetical protein CFP56_34583 [Quercus suber]
MKGKGKAPAVQPKSRKPSVRISNWHEGVSIETVSLQDTLLADAMYSCGKKSVILQKVLCTDLIFQDGEFTDLPLHIKLFLDNLQEALTLRQKPLFRKTLQALELHLVSTGAFIEALSCQLPGKEDGDSSSTKTKSQSLKSYLLGTSLSRLHPKIQQQMRLAIRTLPPEIQQNILTYRALTCSYDKWMYLFKVLVSIAFIRTEDMTDDTWLSHKATWYESFGEADRVYEGAGDRYNPYLGLLINTETGDLDTSYYMEAQPVQILVLIHDWGCTPKYNWYTGDTYLSLEDPGALAQEWFNFMSNKIYEVQKELDRDFNLYGYTNKIAVYGPRPSVRRLIGKRRIAKDPRLMTAKDCVPIYLLISYCALCNTYGVLHKHEQYEDNSNPLCYDNYADID